MEAADVLYGVTMGTDGVSQIVSRRLPREEERRRHGLSANVPAMARSWGELLGEADAPPRDRRRARGFFARLRDSLWKSRRALTEQIAVAAFDPADDAPGSGSRRR